MNKCTLNFIVALTPICHASVGPDGKKWKRTMGARKSEQDSPCMAAETGSWRLSKSSNNGRDGMKKNQYFVPA